MNDDAQAKLYAALAKAQGEVGNASKKRKGQVGQQPYKYADLAAVDEAIGSVLEENGLAILQFPGMFTSGTQEVLNVITHADGGTMEHKMSIPCAQNTPQGAGSALTYARRYALLGILRMVTEDDDGAGAMPKRDTPLTSAARQMTGDTPTNLSSVSRPSSAATGHLTLDMLKKAAGAARFPSPGIIGGYLAGNTNGTAPTEAMLQDWLEKNKDEAPVDAPELLAQAAFWFSENGTNPGLMEKVNAYLLGDKAGAA